MPQSDLCDNIVLLRGHSSVGRALAWHARGRGFESHWLHFATKGKKKIKKFTAENAENAEI